ncbi:MAG: RibD family protein [Candidatus Limnocylindria bacterium]|nr:dihydrofolate reductase family protein [Chloroflexota bacterium]MDQ3399489.1 dihydrofolate reductase family protein [Chloroflexota bacterium]
MRSLSRLGAIATEDLAALHLDLRAPPEHPDRPHVVLNFVVTADGRASFRGRAEIGTRTDRELMFHLRSLVDAVMSGAGTLRVDPFAPVVKDRELQPLAIVVSASGQLPLENRFFRIANRRLVATTYRATEEAASALRHAGAEVLRLGEEEVDLPALLGLLHERGVRSLLCEGGPLLAGALLTRRLVDEIFLTHATRVTAEPGAKRLFESAEPLAGEVHLERVSLHESAAGERYERARVRYSS